MQWDLITNIILATALATLGVFVVMGLYQLFTRGSIKKVDRKILAMIPPLILVVITYFLFDKIWVLSTRPDGSGEPSFPSTHVMVVTTIFFITIFALPKYIKNRTLLIALDLMMCILATSNANGRIVAGQHSVADVIGGLIFATIFAAIYYVLSTKPKKSKKEKELHA